MKSLIQNKRAQYYRRVAHLILGCIIYTVNSITSCSAQHMSQHALHATGGTTQCKATCWNSCVCAYKDHVAQLFVSGTCHDVRLVSFAVYFRMYLQQNGARNAVRVMA